MRRKFLPPFCAGLRKARPNPASARGLRSERRPIGRATVPVLSELSDLHGFMHRVRMEIRRAARSRRPLSLALLRLDNTDVHDKGWAHLWNVIGRRKRETDTVARVGEHLLAVLLVDTDEVGAQAFLRDILDRAASQVTGIVQAYPGHLFVNLARDDPTS